MFSIRLSIILFCFGNLINAEDYVTDKIIFGHLLHTPLKYPEHLDGLEYILPAQPLRILASQPASGFSTLSEEYAVGSLNLNLRMPRSLQEER